MNITVEQLEAKALELPVAQRARLAQVLIASLDAGPDEDPEEVERAWAEEIQRRLDEYDAGTVETIPAADVLAEFRDRPASAPSGFFLLLVRSCAKRLVATISKFQGLGPSSPKTLSVFWTVSLPFLHTAAHISRARGG